MGGDRSARSGFVISIASSSAPAIGSSSPPNEKRRAIGRLRNSFDFDQAPDAVSTNRNYKAVFHTGSNLDHRTETYSNASPSDPFHMRRLRKAVAIRPAAMTVE